MSFTREEMAKIIAQGKSVLHGTGTHQRLISRVEDLPSDAELAGDDADRLTTVRAALVSHRDAIEKEIDAVDARLAGLSTPAKTASDAAATTDADASAKKAAK